MPELVKKKYVPAFFLNITMPELVKKNGPAFFLNITMLELVKKNTPAFFYITMSKRFF